MTTSRKLRGALLLTGAIFTASTLGATSAQAAPRDRDGISSKDYKTGATVLGALGVVLAAKGKTLPAVIAGAGAYYAYKKGEDTHDGYNRYPNNRRSRNDNNRNRDRYSNNDYRYDNNRYPDNRNGSYDAGNYGYNGGSIFGGNVYTENTDNRRNSNTYPDTYRNTNRNSRSANRYDDNISLD